MILLPRVIKQEQYKSAIPFDFTPIIIKPAQKSSEKSTADQGMKTKANSSPVSIVEEAVLKADEIIAEAKKSAQEYLEKIRMQADHEFIEQQKRGYDYGFEAGAEDGKTHGYAEGYEEGLAKGRTDAITAFEKETAAQIDELKEMIMQFDLQKQNFLDEALQDLQFLAVAIARKIIKTELHQNPQDIENIVIASLESYKNQKWIRIRVSSKVADILSQSQQTLNALSNDVKIIPTDSMEEDQCVIETSSGIIDAGAQTQLNIIEVEFKKALIQQNETGTF